MKFWTAYYRITLEVLRWDPVGLVGPIIRDECLGSPSRCVVSRNRLCDWKGEPNN